MSSWVRRTLPCLESTEPERPPPALTNDLLEEIFLRVASPADLARASTACASFRRLISDPGFLRRYRSIHPPLLLGFVSSSGFHPVQAPHPSAAVASSVDRAADFSFDYLPRPAKGHRWHPRDGRDGRVLLECRRKKGFVYWDFVVCDPLSRRYLLLPPVTDDLLASVELEEHNISSSGTSLVPLGGIEDTSFSVIHWMESNTKLGVFIFSSGSGCWSVITSIGWDVLGVEDDIDLFVSGQCMTDCFYWMLFGTSMLIKLDMNSMKFCTMDLPPVQIGWDAIIVEAGEGKRAMICQIDEGAALDYYTFPQDGIERTNGWHIKKTISLPDCYRNYDNYIIGSDEGYIFLRCIPNQDVEPIAYLSLEIKTFNVKRVCEKCSPTILHAFPYSGFPPFISPDRIQWYMKWTRSSGASSVTCCCYVAVELRDDSGPVLDYYNLFYNPVLY